MKYSTANTQLLYILGVILLLRIYVNSSMTLIF